MEGLQKAFVLGRQRDLFFGMPAIEYVYEKIDLSFFERLQSREFISGDIKYIAHLVYGALKGGAERKDDMLDITFADVYDLIERLTFEKKDEHNVIQSAITAFAESNSTKYLLNISKKVGKQNRTGKVLEA